MLDSLAQTLARYDRWVTVIAAIWFWAGIAVYARFVELPNLPAWFKQGFFWGSVAANAIWWTIIHPRVAQHKAALARPDATNSSD